MSDIPPEVQRALSIVLRRRPRKVNDEVAKEIMDEVSREVGYDVSAFFKKKREAERRRKND